MQYPEHPDSCPDCGHTFSTLVRPKSRLNKRGMVLFIVAVLITMILAPLLLVLAMVAAPSLGAIVIALFVGFSPGFTIGTLAIRHRYITLKCNECGWSRAFSMQELTPSTRGQRPSGSGSAQQRASTPIEISAADKYDDPSVRFSEPTPAEEGSPEAFFEDLSSQNKNVDELVWSSGKLRLIREYSAHSISIRTLSTSSNGSHFLSHGHTGSSILWETQTGRQLRSFGEESSLVVFSPDGTRIVNCRKDGLIISRDVANLDDSTRFAGHKGSVYCIAFSPDGKHVVSGGEDGTLRMWEADSGLDLCVEEFSDPVTDTEFEPSGESVLVSQNGYDVFIWDLQNWTKSRDLDLWNLEDVFSVSLSPAGKFVLSYGLVGWKVFNLEVDRDIRNPENTSYPETWGSSLAFSKDDRLMATVHPEGEIEIWQTSPLQKLRKIEADAVGVAPYAFSEDSEFLICGTGASTHMFHVDTGTERMRFPATTSCTTWITIPLGGRGVLTVHNDQSSDRVVRLWSTD